MVSIDISELSTRAAEIVESVQRTGEPIDIQHDGVAVARVVPVVPQPQEGPRAGEDRREAMARWLKETEEFAQRLGRIWPAGVSAQDVIDDIRGPW